MIMKKKIKVLIVEDSMLFRETLSRGLSIDSSLEILPTAANAYEARDRIEEYEPDVITLDIELPRMNGIEFLKRLMPQYPVPVIVVSAVNGIVFEALNAGAVDFVAKPDFSLGGNIESFINEITVKIKIASNAKVGKWKSELTATREISQGLSYSSDTILAIGASTGGTEALFEILKGLPRDIPGTLIVQHMPPVFTRMFAERLNNSCRMEVKEAQNGDRIVPGRVLIAPGDFHMKLKRTGGIYSVDCVKGERVNGHCPSVDVMFHSVADCNIKNVIGVILTGMGYDGAKGLLKLRKAGAKTIGQDEASSIVYGMPKVAYEIGAVERQYPLNSISQVICSMLGSR